MSSLSEREFHRQVRRNNWHTCENPDCPNGENGRAARFRRHYNTDQKYCKASCYRMHRARLRREAKST